MMVCLIKLGSLSTCRLRFLAFRAIGTCPLDIVIWQDCTKVLRLEGAGKFSHSSVQLLEYLDIPKLTEWVI